VLEIQPLRVRFAVENFGQVRNEVLELRGNNQLRMEPIREAPAAHTSTAVDTSAAAPRRPNNPRLNPDTIKPIRQEEGRR
jgi:hypothetical protein